MLSYLDPLTDMVAPKRLVWAVYHQLVTDPAQRNDFVKCVWVDFCPTQRAPRTDFERLGDAAKAERVSTNGENQKSIMSVCSHRSILDAFSLVCLSHRVTLVTPFHLPAWRTDRLGKVFAADTTLETGL